MQQRGLAQPAFTAQSPTYLRPLTSLLHWRPDSTTFRQQRSFQQHAASMAGTPVAERRKQLLSVAPM